MSFHLGKEKKLKRNESTQLAWEKGYNDGYHNKPQEIPSGESAGLEYSRGYLKGRNDAKPKPEFNPFGK